MTYVGLPAARGGAHSLGRMSRRHAHERVSTFLASCTASIGAVQYSLRVLDVPELPRQPRLEQLVRQAFGAGATVPVDGDRVGDALDLLDRMDPQPTNRWGMAPVLLTLEARFRLLDPSTGHPLPGQDPARFDGAEYVWSVPLGISGLRLFLDNRCSLALELCIPDADDEILSRLVPSLQAHLPCTLSSEQWRSWTRTRAGSYRARKIRAPGVLPGTSGRRGR